MTGATLQKDFTTLRKTQIEELQCTYHELRHERTGAIILHIECDDPENVFCLSLETLPEDSTGIAHILEHMVLCGSKKFPVKDPFFSMIRRSMNTFMNAFTGSDFTCYPAASQVERDFYNLLEVYADAVFHPKIDSMSFMQEGHRFEFEYPEDKTSPLKYSGIVYNEMKGAYASPDSRLFRETSSALFPDITYHYDSGGFPEDIPNLSHEELLAFHKKYYHPSRCLFYFYGNLPLEKHLDFLRKHVFTEDIEKQARPRRKYQPRLNQPFKVKSVYPAQQDEKAQNLPMMSLSWMTLDLSDPYKLLIMNLLDTLLMGSDAAVLKKALLESKLCQQASSYLDLESLQVPYYLFLKGLTNEDSDKLKELTFATLQKVLKEGFDPGQIASAIHQLQLEKMEITGGRFPFGLILFFRAGLSMQLGADGLDSLQLKTYFDRLKKLEKDPSDLLQVLKEEFVENPHHGIVYFSPDPELTDKENEKESIKLKQIEASLSEAEKDEIVKQSEALKQHQEESEEDLIDVLPKIKLSEVPTKAKDYLLKQESNIETHSNFTNGFTYIDLYLNLSKLPIESFTETNWCELRLLCTLWPQIGAAGRSYVENLQLIELMTGGIEAHISAQSFAEEENNSRVCLTFSIHGLNENTEPFLKLAHEVLFKPEWNNPGRISLIVDQAATALENSINNHALNYAILESSKSFSPTASISQMIGGLPFLKYMRAIKKEIDENGAEKLIERLILLHRQIIEPGVNKAILSCEEQQVALASKSLLKEFKLEDSAEPFSLYRKRPEEGKSCGIGISSQVAFNTLTLPGVSYTDENYPALLIASSLISNFVLHKEIREKGGAYGYGCKLNHNLGTLTLHTYRDPHIKRSYEVFDEALEKISKGDFSSEELEEAKLYILQKLDTPTAPGCKASTAYSWKLKGLNLTQRQINRERLIKLSKAQVQIALKEHMAKHSSSAIKSLCAGKEAIQKELPYLDLTSA